MMGRVDKRRHVVNREVAPVHQWMKETYNNCVKIGTDTGKGDSI